MVDNALTSGETPCFTISKIFKGKVIEPGPLQKKLMTISSSDKDMESIAPEITPGIINGKVT